METDSLHIIEKKVIRALGKLGKADVDTIVKETGLNEDQVRRGVEWLRNKEIAEVNKHSKEAIKIAKNGIEYSKSGMPEKRFIHALSEPMGLEKLREKARLDKDELNYCIGFFKKKAFISFSEGKVKLTSMAKNYLEAEDKAKEFLKVLANGELSTENLKEEQKSLVKDLQSRKDIISVESKSDSYYSLSEKGKKILPTLKEEKEGEVIGQLTPEIIASKEWKNKKFRAYDIQSLSPKVMTGKKHPYKRFIDKVRIKLASMGFKEMNGPLVENSFYNCEALFMPQDHPAKGVHDIYYIKKPKERGNLSSVMKFVNNVKKMHEDKWKYNFSIPEAEKLVLRSQGTAMSARMLMSKDLEIPGKYFAIGTCFRPDVVDAMHLSEFKQVEGIVVDYNLTLRDLFGMLRMFAEEIAQVDKWKIIPGYYPFTEPSAVVYGQKKGIKGGKWFEIGGSGIFRPELTKPLGIDATVLAWGLGFDRQFMASKGIKDMRTAYSSDAEWLKKMDVVV